MRPVECSRPTSSRPGTTRWTSPSRSSAWSTAASPCSTGSGTACSAPGASRRSCSALPASTGCGSPADGAGISLRVWRIFPSSAFEQIIGGQPIDLLSLPLDGDRPWYAHGLGRDPALRRVEDAAPLRLAPPDQPDGPFDPLTRDDERTRILAHETSLIDACELMVDDPGTLPTRQRASTDLPAANGKPRQIVDVRVASALLAQAMDPGIGRYLGLVDFLDERPDPSEPTAYAAIGSFAIDSRAKLMDERRVVSVIGQLDPLTQRICEHFRDEIGGDVSDVVERHHLAERCLIAVAGAVPPPDPPRVRPPDLGRRPLARPRGRPLDDVPAGVPRPHLAARIADRARPARRRHVGDAPSDNRPSRARVALHARARAPAREDEGGTVADSEGLRVRCADHRRRGEHLPARPRRPLRPLRPLRGRRRSRPGAARPAGPRAAGERRLGWAGRRGRRPRLAGTRRRPGSRPVGLPPPGRVAGHRVARAGGGRDRAAAESARDSRVGRDLDGRRPDDAAAARGRRAAPLEAPRRLREQRRQPRARRGGRARLRRPAPPAGHPDRDRPHLDEPPGPLPRGRAPACLARRGGDEVPRVRRRREVAGRRGRLARRDRGQGRPVGPRAHARRPRALPPADRPAAGAERRDRLPQRAAAALAVDGAVPAHRPRDRGRPRGGLRHLRRGRARRPDRPAASASARAGIGLGA